MKTNILLLGVATLALMGGAFTSCKPDYQTKFEVKTLTIPDNSQAPIIIPREGKTEEIPVSTNVALDNWQAYSNADWCHIEKQKDKVVVTFDQSDLYVIRYGVLTIKYGHQEYDIELRQLGKGGSMIFGDTGTGAGTRDKLFRVISGATTSLDIPITTSIAVDHVLVPDSCPWIQLSKMVDEEHPLSGSQQLPFTIEPNVELTPRYCTVIVQSSLNYDIIGKFVIKQEARGTIVSIVDDAKVFDVVAAGGPIIVPFQTNGQPPAQAYTISIEESAKSWITTTSTRLRGMTDLTETFNIAPNIDMEHGRTGHITFTSVDPSENSSFVVTVNQAKFVPVPPHNVENISAEGRQGYIDLSWTLPQVVDYQKLVITYMDKAVGHEVTVELNNTDTHYRVTNTYAGAGDYTFTFKTYGVTGMVTETPKEIPGESLTAYSDAFTIKYPLAVSMISANATQPGDGQGLPALFDNNIDTYYHTLWQGNPNPQTYHFLQFDLPNAVPGVSFSYKPRHNNASAAPRIVDIYVSNDATPVNTSEGWIKVGTLNYDQVSGDDASAGNVIAPSTPKGIIFPRPYKHIRYVVTGRNNELNLGTNKPFWNVSELMMYTPEKSPKEDSF